MNKRVVSKSLYVWLKHEAGTWAENGIISQEQAGEVLDSYAVKPGLNFIRVILVVGAFLVGLGVLSFIASNWADITKPVKFGLIVLGFLGVNAVSCWMAAVYPKTSRALLYLGMLIYGGGIFLTGQIFNLGGYFATAFLLWAVGIFPAAVMFKDKLLYVSATLLLLVYINGNFAVGSAEPYAVLAAIPVLYYCNRYFDQAGVITFFCNLLVLDTVFYFAVDYRLEALYTAALMFAIGLAMVYFPVKTNREVFRFQGGLVVGIAGLFLTVKQVWETWESMPGNFSPTAASIIFSLAFIIYLLWLVRKEDLMALVFVAAVIFRYYVDLTYDFLPKSIFFVVGGIVLLAFGYYIERTRKKRRGADNAA